MPWQVWRKNTRALVERSHTRSGQKKPWKVVKNLKPLKKFKGIGFRDTSIIIRISILWCSDLFTHLS